MLFSISLAYPVCRYVARRSDGTQPAVAHAGVSGPNVPTFLLLETC